ncbi:hypothetical protein Anapl_03646 [Anas platyrhynchos]|uniref:Uncharacterized protein n=1 Tax=Anas platyrhynchos TaxID=8839 RepID=R0LYK4_ANAPL|nr:hypothetical protein Anapl_03646 [Anas platyrhynchos]
MLSLSLTTVTVPCGEHAGDQRCLPVPLCPALGPALLRPPRLAAVFFSSAPSACRSSPRGPTAVKAVGSDHHSNHTHCAQTGATGGSPADLKGAKEELSPAGGGEQTHCEQDWPGIAALQEGSPAFPCLAPSPASSRAQAAAPQLQEQGPGLQTPAPDPLQQPPSVPRVQRLALPLLHAASTLLPDPQPEGVSPQQQQCSQYSWGLYRSCTVYSVLHRGKPWLTEPSVEGQMKKGPPEKQLARGYSNNARGQAWHKRAIAGAFRAWCQKPLPASLWECELQPSPGTQRSQRCRRDG